MTDFNPQSTLATTPIADAWGFFAKHALPFGCSDMQRDDMHYAFWAGAATVFAKIAEAMGIEDEDERCVALEALSEEIRVMGELVDGEQTAKRSTDTKDQGKPTITGKIVKVDPVTGDEVATSPEEERRVLAMMREALDQVEGGVVFSEEATAKLRERGMSEDEIKSLLAGAIGHQQ